MRTIKRERGVMLIEALIAILIFSIGILAVVGMQSTAIRTVTDAKVRSDAGFLVNELMAQIWTDKANITAYAYPGSGAVPARLTGWVARVNSRLPGTVPPTVTITGGTPVGGLVQVTVFWRLPQEATLGVSPHQHTMLAYIASNPPTTP
ncbi:MAG TPA: pilus assembly protein PilV [Burkholderiales bacterium]|nr:pilus assembly protein PilV [Burkholderiales bacterium]